MSLHDISIGKSFERHPSVFHYTDGAGLFGILNEGKIWATHFNGLNDSSEIRISKGYFVEAFQDVGVRLESQKKYQIAPDGPDQAVETLYKTAFGPSDAIGQPFVVSFCGAPEDEYTFENGLLNMWQAYGPGGGFALQFDTKTVHDLASTFFKKSAAYASLGTVTYGPDTEDWAGRWKQIQNVSELIFPATIESQITGTDLVTPLGTKVWTDFVQICMHVKHRAFVVEKEVRLGVLRLDVAEPGQLEMEIHFRPSASGPVAFVKLFEGKEVLQALRRVIVGPHPQSIKRAELVEFYCRSNGLDVEVTRSDIPFVPTK
jgi:hypothetical protein